MNLWVLTEERPRVSSLCRVLNKFIEDNKFCGFVGDLRVIPILEKEKFTFVYELIGVRCNKISKIFIRIVSGSSSFVDFLVFYQKEEPKEGDAPIYCIEETKTDDSESRNTGVYQRCSKFVYLDNYYPCAKKIMLYNLQIKQKEKPTETNIFGTRLLLTMGVEILGKEIDTKIFKPFTTLDEVITAKNAMRKPPEGNVPIEIHQKSNTIYISGRLFKTGGLAHDPNIGALSIISAVIRKLGWSGEIVIIKHGLQQNHLKAKNKFIIIANKLNVRLGGLSLPCAVFPSNYWCYDIAGEKLGTIFLHIAAENFAQGRSIFENHAGCEKGYFITKEGEYLSLAKYEDRVAYKAGDKTKIIAIPDLILLDMKRNKIINIEGKKYSKRKDGIAELAAYDAMENIYVKKYYPGLPIIRTVVLYGGKEKKLVEIEVGFLLNSDGDLVLGIKSPDLFGEAIENLLDFWK